jgi:hypothetical protein
MSQSFDPQHIASLRAVHAVPGMDSVTHRRDMPFPGADGEPLLMDLFVPVGNRSNWPAVVIVSGYPDSGVTRIFGRSFREMGATVSWARLIAASGLVAIAATNRRPELDAHALMTHLAANGRALGIDPDRVGVFASSGNSVVALSMLMGQGVPPRCAALLFPYLMDLGDDRAVVTAASTFGFVNSTAGRGVRDLATGTPLFLARAGKDQMPGLNQSMDRFIAAALAANLPLTVVNHSTGPHAADLFDPGDATQRVIQATLGFLVNHLSSNSS